MDAIGRPRCRLNLTEFESFHSHGMSWTQISSSLGMCARTLRRRRIEMNLPEKYTLIGQEDLTSVILEIMTCMPNAGERLVCGALASRGIHVQRSRVRRAIQLVDGVGRQLRRCEAIQRRTYNVKGPNYLWHVDTCHKLISWRFVIHGCVDGFSRVMTHLECHLNNTANTALSCFFEGVHKFGIPSRCRGDRGVENVGIAKFMLKCRGCNRGSFIAGRSVHNQRIEHMWGHVNRVSITHTYREIFMYMEHNGILDSTSELHLLCLHYVFLPRIQKSLDEIKRAWNSHRMRTEHNLSPIALWEQGMLVGLGPQQQVPLPDLQAALHFSLSSVGMEIVTRNNIVVPEVDRDVMHWHERLTATLDPMSNDGNSGIVHFMHCVQTLEERNEVGQ